MAYDNDGERGNYNFSMCKLVRDNYAYDTKDETGRCNAGLGHRLDKETSGCVLIGKTKDSWKHLRQQFHDGVHSVYKEYYCLCYGVTPEYGTINAKINPVNLDRAKFLFRVRTTGQR